MRWGLRGLFSPERPTARARVRWQKPDTAIYAVGDVHGCLDKLVALESRIVADGAGIDAPKLIVMLGDYVDKGPASAQVLDHLAAPPPPGFERICLAGNHEVRMLDYVEGRVPLAKWLNLDGETTLASYGIDLARLGAVYRDQAHVDAVIRAAIPAEHVAFLKSLPVMLEARSFVFVHAGIRPGVALERQSDDDLVSIRSAFFDNADRLDRYVVHGHTPVTAAERAGRRLNIDTGACLGGPLTAVRIWRNRGHFFTA